MSNLTKTQLINTLEINALANQKLHFSLPSHWDKSKRKEYFFESIFENKDRSSNKYLFSICEKGLFGRQMNIEKITTKFIHLYSFDIFGNENKAKIALNQIEITKQ